MDSPMLSRAGFELVDSPIRTPCINLGEFEEDPSPLQQAFCRNLTEHQYQVQASTETEKALIALIEHLENDPSTLLKILQRRKQEEIEHSGFVTSLKARIMKNLQGDKYYSKLVSMEECKGKVDEMTQGMLMVYNYAQEKKGSRFSKRLALKRGMELNVNNTPLRSLVSPKRHRKNKENAAQRPALQKSRGAESKGVPAPPPLPPHALTPLRDRTSMLNSPSIGELKRPPLRNGSTGSLVSVHEELLGSNPLQRLRPIRTPGGTPIMRKKPCLNVSSGSLDFSTPAALKNQEPLASMFMRILEQKFRNIRSPSPAPSPTAFSPGDFSP